MCLCVGVRVSVHVCMCDGVRVLMCWCVCLRYVDVLPCVVVRRCGCLNINVCVFVCVYVCLCVLRYL